LANFLRLSVVSPFLPTKEQFMKAIYSIGLALTAVAASVGSFSNSYAQNGPAAPAAVGAKGPKEVPIKGGNVLPDGKVAPIGDDRVDPNSPKQVQIKKKSDPKEDALKSNVKLVKKKNKLESDPCTNKDCSEQTPTNPKGTKLCPKGQSNC
jgi:hypothetical protein